MKDFVEQEDARKLHNEINQLSNQRFLLMTLSITIFIGFLGILLPKDVNENRSSLTIVFCIIFELFIFFIFIISNTIRHISRCEATYLIAKEMTQWEQPWKIFREYKTYSGFSYVERMIYPILILTASIIPILFTIVFNWHCSLWNSLPLVIAGIIELMIFRQYKKFAQKEDEALIFWQETIKAFENSLELNQIDKDTK